MVKFIRRAWPLLLAAALMMGRVPGTLALVMERTPPVVNTFRPDESVDDDCTVSIRVDKTLLDGEDQPLPPGGFRFTLSTPSGEAITATTDASGRAVFRLTYRPEDAGEHLYYLAEVNDARPDILYSERVYEIRAVVTVNEGLTAAVYLDGERVQQVVAPFENLYLADPDVPDTGDHAPVGLYAALMLLSAAGLLALHKGKRYAP